MSTFAAAAPAAPTHIFNHLHFAKSTYSRVSALVGACLLSGFGLKRLAPQLSSRSSIALSLLATALPAFFATTRWKRILFEVSLIWTSFDCWRKNYSWWNEITPNIVLGAIPLAEQADALRDSGITAQLTMLEECETEPGLIRMWDCPNHHETIHAPDFRGVPAEMIERGVEWVRRQVEAGGKVYIHCKAGRGRSATIVVAYLMRYHGMNFAQAYAFVRERRPQINLNQNQQRAITTWFASRPQ